MGLFSLFARLVGTKSVVKAGGLKIISTTEEFIIKGKGVNFRTDKVSKLGKIKIGDVIIEINEDKELSVTSGKVKINGIK